MNKSFFIYTVSTDRAARARPPVAARGRRRATKHQRGLFNLIKDYLVPKRISNNERHQILEFNPIIPKTY